MFYFTSNSVQPSKSIDRLGRISMTPSLGLAAMPAALVCLLVLVAGTSALPSQEPRGPHLAIPEVIERGERGPTLILIPCAGCGAASWERFMEVNADRFRMLAVTLPGYDGSPRPGLPLWSATPVFQNNAVAQLAKLIESRGLSGAVVVGHSFGSTIGLRLANERPDLVSVLVNVDGLPLNPPGRRTEPIAKRVAKARASVDDNWAIQLQSPAAFRRFNAAGSLPGAEQRLLHHGMFMASDRVSMLHYWRENFLVDTNPGFRAFRGSYLDIKAIGARIVRADSVLDAYDKTIEAVGKPVRYARVVFHDTRHWIHLERPRLLGAVILDHLAGRSSADVGPFRFGEVVRSGTGPRDVILMPCLGCDASSWDEFMERNGQLYRMFALTWPGMGDTRLPMVEADSAGTPYFDYLMESLRLLIERD
ncbi:MAG: alpha/beta fold hydrolase [Longimicrobiales bacterium]